MKPTIGSFLIGSVSTLGFAQTLQAAQSVSSLPQEVLNSIETIISLIGGILSSVFVAWLKHKWNDKQPPAVGAQLA